MDNRTGRRNREQARDVPELGTDTVPVNLVELQRVGGRNRSPMPLFLVGIAIAAIVAFAAGASLARPRPEASPSPAPVALASDGAATAITQPASLGPSPGPSSTPRVTPRLTPAPTRAPWAWTRTDIPTDGLMPQRIWTLDDRVVVLLNGFKEGVHRDLWQIALFSDGDWSTETISPAITWLFGGTVVDGRVWFLASVAGAVEGNDVTWQLVSTDGQAWEALPPVRGLDELNGFDFLARIDGRWVAAARQHGICCDGGGQTLELVWSRDGVEWNVADVPTLPAEVSDFRAAVRGGEMVVVSDVADLAHRWAVLTSTSGRTWQQVKTPLTRFDEMTALACNASICVITTSRDTAVVLDGANGAASYDIPIPRSSVSDVGLRPLIATSSGFIAMSGDSGNALVSRDGAEWFDFEVMPLGLSRPVIDMAVEGDTILAIDDSFGAGAYSLWRGSLPELRL